MLNIQELSTGDKKKLSNEYIYGVTTYEETETQEWNIYQPLELTQIS